MSARSSCAVLGADAAHVARTALRRGGPGGLLIQLGGTPMRGRRPVLWRRSVNQTAAEAGARLPDGCLAYCDGRLACVLVPEESAGDSAVLELVQDHDGPVAIAVCTGRDDRIDALLRTVDEVILVEPSDPDVRELALEELRLLGNVNVVGEPARRQQRGAAAAGADAAGDRSPTALIGGERGQSTVAVLAIIAVVLIVAAAFASVASALGRGADEQGRADVAALAAAKVLLDTQQGLFSFGSAQRLGVAQYRAGAVAAARASTAANGLQVERVDVGGPAELPNRVTVTVRRSGPRIGRASRTLRAVAEVAVQVGNTELASGGGYAGPLATRQGKQMRPDVALAFDRMVAAARGAGVTLVIVSAFRSDAEQARLFAANPDPKWVAPPGKSLHRLGTELDLGPASAYGWLAANAGKFGFLKRYAWEPWHFGYVRSAGSASVGYSGSRATATRQPREGGERSGSAIPSFIPSQYAPLIAKAAQRWSIGAALLGAQLQVETGFNPRAVSPAGAAGIAQFMPGTAAAYGLTPAERFDPAKAIDAQAHHMHDLMRRFASVPLALAAYNAGAGAVGSCMCIPPYRETQDYVRKILALLGGAGIAAPAGFEIRLVE